MNKREEAKRLIEDIYQIEDAIDYLQEILRSESYDEDNPDEENIDTQINNLINELSYLNNCYSSDYDEFDWEELTNEVFKR